MCKDTTNNGVSQEKNLFSFQDVLELMPKVP